MLKRKFQKARAREMGAVSRHILSFIRNHNKITNLSSPPYSIFSSLPISHVINLDKNPILQSPNPNSYFTPIYRSISSTLTRPCDSKQNPQTRALNPNPRTRTPLEKQFDTWVHKLKPGFSHSDVVSSLRTQSDADLALDIFRWTAQQRGYRHDATTYQNMIEISAAGKRYGATETLIDEVVSGACSGSPSLYNTIIKFCCSRKHLFNRSFDVYRRMQKLPDCKPTLETYTLLLNSLLRRFNRLNVCYVYLHAVRSLLKQMKASGVIPDTFALNLIIKAYSKCLEMDEAIRVFREMGLYGCEPDSYTYSYITKGLCEKGRVGQGWSFYKEMREKGLVPSNISYMILICSLALGQRFEDAVEVVYDMLSNSMIPDFLTYKTVLEGLCREGRENEAFELLKKFREKDGTMGERIYSNLLHGLNLLCRG